ncbi:DUF1295-domain-containing protein [Coniophora puteana RWD-64-598 SS2]|uniref:DUF1295-domain-containing protein n=1 Tax=Coniophora puteana (strain RWD-64-598) TaxID=741705 RepID=A0A5M3MYK6_CONPW|nr:DUF1295-domain-containing protein [Coniophora puteana RWD-64-598 SS2]EIW84199.1 DUF1295-domain-containing protein [Coniophora puteana RWD-64-598 SS2]
MASLQLLEQAAPTLVWPVKFCLAITTTLYLLSLITGNVSQADRVWTFLPTVYAVYYALIPLWPNSALALFPYTPSNAPYFVASTFSPRAVMMATLIVLWMYRLSYNTWRRGLFSLKDEDYRWELLRQQIPNKNIILFILPLPTHMAVHQPHSPLSTSDYVLCALALLTNVVQFTADNQQWSYQNYKHSGVLNANEWPGARIQWTKQDAERGFVTRGLWAWSRHPNFLCEQTFWILINLFPILSPASPHLTAPPHKITDLTPLLPSLVITSLFYSSTLFSESVSRGKYTAAYPAYQERVAMFIPLFTPVWGLWLSIRGKKEATDRLVYGAGDHKKTE